MRYINIRPLLEANFTGIPQLTWHVARYWLEQPPNDVRFFIGSMEVARNLVESIVTQRTGRYLAALRNQHYDAFTLINPEDARGAVALFPHTRELREKTFQAEVQIFHDLTGLITPEFHPKDLVGWETRRMVNDTAQIDCFVCVSEATRQDLVSYFDIAPSRTRVAYPGVAWFPEHQGIYSQLSQSTFDQYVLVFGTFEPRKNIELVFEYLATNPRILDEYIFCFCGSEGWGGVYQRCTQNPKIKPYIQSGRIRIMQFVNERLKYALMKEASFLLYPSFLEGFGSPVAEALSLGVPVVTSYGGSIPEVAGQAGYYFDPISLESMSQAIRQLVADLRKDTAKVRRAAIEQGRKFTWLEFNRSVHSAIDEFSANE